MKPASAGNDWKKKTIFFIISQAITIFGSSLVQMAIIWYVTVETSSGAWVTALTLSSLLPQVLISFFAGAWADRYSRKRLIIFSDIAIAAATLVLAVFLIAGNLGSYELFAIILVSIVRSVGSGIQSPAVSAMIPQFVPEEHLLRFNSINGSIQSLVQFSAPAAAGALLAAGPIHRILLIDILTAVIGVGFLALIKIPSHRVTKDDQTTGIFTEIKEGIQYAFGDRLIGRLLLIYGAFIFLSVPSGFLTSLMVQRAYGENYTYLSIAEMCGFAGMVLSGLVVGAWGGFKNRNKTLALGILIYGFFAILLGLVQPFWSFVLVLFLMCLAIPVAQTATITLLQEKTPPDKQGRVFSLLSIMFNSFLPLGMVLFGPLADIVSIRSLMIGTGFPLVLLAFSLPFQKQFFQRGMLETNPDQ
jgi:DHA3 family macrolide efflux protein-like MFS transporter